MSTLNLKGKERSQFQAIFVLSPPKISLNDGIDTVAAVTSSEEFDEALDDSPFCIRLFMRPILLTFVVMASLWSMSMQQVKRVKSKVMTKRTITLDEKKESHPICFYMNNNLLSSLVVVLLLVLIRVF
ncbi:hypothetical protein ScalyP_jg3692 [Parmales sp. scaly parma]|nr:hypothetical protein ScalyP_jg3692 [Parmales sp. scaly parma]